MAFLDRLLGRNITLDTLAPPTNDEQAVERYEYLLRTAKPDTIEQAHVDAFERLTQQQRDLVFERFIAESPAGERPTDAAPATLAKSATRAEAREPGILTRTFGGNRTDAGGNNTANAGLFGGSFLGTFATYAIASSAIDAIFWTGLIGATLVANNAAADSPDAGGDGGGDGGADFFGSIDF